MDLEEEQERYHLESEKLVGDIRRITKDLDDEILNRFQLESQKSSLIKEIQFLKDVHSHEIEELKGLNMKDTNLDPAKFFKYELSNAIKGIRKDYEQLNQQQRNELESWYHLKVNQAVRSLLNQRFNNTRFRFR